MLIENYLEEKEAGDPTLISDVKFFTFQWNHFMDANAEPLFRMENQVNPSHSICLIYFAFGLL